MDGAAARHREDDRQRGVQRRPTRRRWASRDAAVNGGGRTRRHGDGVHQGRRHDDQPHRADHDVRRQPRDHPAVAGLRDVHVGRHDPRVRPPRAVAPQRQRGGRRHVRRRASSTAPPDRHLVRGPLLEAGPPDRQHQRGRARPCSTTRWSCGCPSWPTATPTTTTTCRSSSPAARAATSSRVSRSTSTRRDARDGQQRGELRAAATRVGFGTGSNTGNVPLNKLHVTLMNALGPPAAGLGPGHDVRHDGHERR